MAKPELIKILESNYQVTLKKVKAKDFDENIYNPSYEVNNEGAVVSLNLRYLKVSDIGFIQNINTLKRLVLAENPIKNHSALRYLTNLELLDLSETGLNDITFISDLQKVENLNLSDNTFSVIESIGELKNLRSLDLSRNKINNFSVLNKLSNLHTLKLWTCNLVSLEPIKMLTQLANLALWENNIYDISILEKFKDLQSLDIGKNQIGDMSPIKKLQKLRVLEIDNCGLSDIQFIKDSHSIESLNISSNSITDIDPLKHLKNLSSLNARFNKIEDLKPLGRLKKLESLSLLDNQVTDLRPLHNMIDKGIRINLKDKFRDEGINLTGNFTTIPPAEVLETHASIIQYFDDAKKYGLKPLNECKIILLGDGELGKTSLMKQIVGLPFSEEKTTHGINKKSWAEIKNENGEDVKVNLWDFGGQHIQHSLHQFFLTEHVIYILLLNPRNDTNAMYWLEQIHKLGKDSEILVVYNWKDSKDKESHSVRNFYELRKVYPNLSDPFLLSCKTGEGFENFKRHLIETILNRQDLSVQYPLNWFNIKNNLEENVTVNKNFILYREYDDICRFHNYENELSKRNLLKQLNKIGSIVFFDKPILNDLQVLNPDWITTGAYSVLTAELTTERKGHVKYDDLLEIFKDEKYLFANEEIKLRYLEKDFLFILALMTEYDICVNNPFANNEYLIPCAFEGEKPSEFDKYKDDSVHYRFRFDSSFEMLIMYRFMARNISKSVEKNSYWQSGIIIKDPHSETYAMVETNQYSKIIDFWIKGEAVRALWEVLRHDIKDINQQYSLQYEEEVLYEINSGREIFLSYDELISSLKNGVREIQYHPIHKIFNIDVLNVLEKFEDSKKLIKEMKGNKIVVKGDLVNNAQFQVGGENNSQSTYINNYQENPKVDELKDILEDLEDLANGNQDWQISFGNALTELHRLQNAKDQIEQTKSESKLLKFFKKAKDLKDLVAIGVLPAEIMVKGGKMIELAKMLFGAI